MRAGLCVVHKVARRVRLIVINNLNLKNMKTLTSDIQKVIPNVETLLKLSTFALLFWLAASSFRQGFSSTAALIDPAIFQVIGLAILTWALLLVVTAWLFRVIYHKLHPAAGWNFVTQFNVLLPWQQFAFYWACYALLLCSATGCLIAIC